MAGSVGQPTQAWFAWQAFKSSVGTPVRTNASTSLGMGYMDLPNAQNNEIVWPLYLDSVTYKIASIGTEGTNLGIATFLFDGVSLGTIDWYAGAGAGNTYKEATVVSITTPKAADLTMRAATKNASSIGYLLHTNSIAIIKISGTSSSPSGTDTPGYTVEILPWMGTKGATSSIGRTQSSTALGGGYETYGPASGAEWNSDIWADAGSFTGHYVHVKNMNRGIATWRFDATDLGTIDGYAAAAAENTYSTITFTVATAGVKNWKVISNTKNASATDFYVSTQSAKVTRTGA